MEKKLRKLYEKAMNLYEQGEIDSALDICELALSKELNNSSILNFKGMLLYQKGKLNEAITVWKLNKDLNNDTIASSYIKDAQSDFERLDLYERSEEALKKLNIELALELLSRCALSDFNSIKVNTGLAICYQKKGDYKKAYDYIEKALRIDCNYKEAIRIKKELIDFGGDKLTKKSSKKFIAPIILFTAIIIICGSIALFMRNNHENLFNNKSSNNLITSNDNEKDLNKENSDPKKQDKKEEIDNEKNNGDEEIHSGEDNNKYNEDKGTDFDSEKIKQLIADKNIDALVNELRVINKEDIGSENIYLYRQAIDLINAEGVANYYNRGLEYYNQKNYENAEIEFDKAYDFCENNDYKEHILFYRASNLSMLMKNELAIKQYEEYYKDYPNGVYTEGALYELAMLTNSVDKEKSKAYANELINNFPKSIYINEYITNILNS